MEQLNTFDSVFLEAEDSDRHVSLAVGGLSVVEGPMPDFDDFIAAMAERIRMIPRFRQVLHTHFLDLAPPDWVDDPNFDIAHHVHRAALPQPGGDAELFRISAEIMERRLDRDRPLWECWIIDGLASGRWAMLTKMHHCIADGIATMHIFSGLSDGGDGDTFATRIHAANDPRENPARTPTISLNPLKWASGMWQLAVGAAGATASAVEGAVEIAGSFLNPAPESTLTGPVTTMRRYSAARVSLDDVKKVSDAFGVTLNDVVLAAITDSFRSALVRRGEKPRRNSLRTALMKVAAAKCGDLGYERARTAAAVTNHGTGGRARTADSAHRTSITNRYSDSQLR
jgi:diacylglycerol O-acyltransferase